VTFGGRKKKQKTLSLCLKKKTKKGNIQQAVRENLWARGFHARRPERKNSIKGTFHLQDKRGVRETRYKEKWVLHFNLEKKKAKGSYLGGSERIGGLNRRKVK